VTISIQEIKLHRVQMSLKHPFKTSFGVVERKDFFITEVINHDGTRGYGESVAFTVPWYTEETTETCLHVIESFLIPLLREHSITHPDDVTDIFRVIRRNNMAKSALEGAIWDLHAKQQGVSLARALGGLETSIDVGISIGMKPTIDDLLSDVEESVDQGFKRVKVKIQPGWDIAVLREIRHHFPSLDIMADANSAYTLRDAPHLKQFDDLQLLMIEQPLAHDDLIDHAKLQQQIKTPICLDESIHSIEDVRQALALRSCQIINVKIGRVGGLTEAKRIHDLCKEHNIPVWCGGMLESGVGRAHNIALSTLPQFVLPGDIAGSAHYWKKDIIMPEVVVEDGEIFVPDAAGIGVNIDKAALEQFTVAQYSYSFD